MCINSAQQRGFSLIELVIFIVIMSVAVVGVLGVMNITTRYSADPMIQKQALAIAESLLEEVELKDFNNPTGGFTGGVTLAERPLFDDVHDFNNFSTSGIYTIDGTAVGGLGAYNVSVAVTNAALGAITAASGEAVRITVTVTHSTGQSWAVSGYRTNYAP